MFCLGSGHGAVRPHSEGEEMDKEEEHKKEEHKKDEQIRVNTRRIREQLASVSFAALQQ